MTSQIPEQQLSQASDFVAATLGLYFPRARWNALERQAKLAAREFGFGASRMSSMHCVIRSCRN